MRDVPKEMAGMDFDMSSTVLTITALGENGDTLSSEGL